MTTISRRFSLLVRPQRFRRPPRKRQEDATWIAVVLLLALAIGLPVYLKNGDSPLDFAPPSDDSTTRRDSWCPTPEQRAESDRFSPIIDRSPLWAGWITPRRLRLAGLAVAVAGQDWPTVAGCLAQPWPSRWAPPVELVHRRYIIPPESEGPVPPPPLADLDEQVQKAIPVEPSLCILDTPQGRRMIADSVESIRAGLDSTQTAERRIEDARFKLGMLLVQLRGGSQEGGPR